MRRLLGGLPQPPFLGSILLEELFQCLDVASGALLQPLEIARVLIVLDQAALVVNAEGMRDTLRLPLGSAESLKQLLGDVDRRQKRGPLQVCDAQVEQPV